jgi:predicted dehydrogenase
LPSPIAGCIRWGILGTGHIASKFADDLTAVPEARLAAVASRTGKRALRFRPDMKIPARYGSYQELASDPDVDAVYIATPHAFHRDHSVLCLDAGKAVLCEKPFAVNRGQALDMAGAARRNGVFLMEAMWTRFLPHIRKLCETVRSGRIGRVRLIEADFGFKGSTAPDGRLLNPALGGGALLDVGIYPLTLAVLLMGRPDRIESMATVGATGVDEQCGMVLGYADGAMAVLSASIAVRTSQTAVVAGTGGRIEIRAPWWKSGEFAVFPEHGDSDLIRLPPVGNGFTYEIEEVCACVRRGDLESGILPPGESIAMMEIMDRMRKSWGMKYPGE